ncbi:ATP-binding cassette domain-containing protein [Cognatilysobacter terrigena]|uniref:ATP-binding cassette domain-containing protein n=1 Tax=Cognatilysobacter terrigena TaxID=2488749 RepID=UPI00105E2CCE|nr:ATP-binding cassette domain-containing protein [Lysobacter terrigena]
MHRIDVRLRRGGFERRVHLQSASRVVAVIGASGSGKTSLLHAVAGLVRPVEGRIEVAGECLFDSARRIDIPAHRRRSGYVFQDGRLFPHLDVRANLLYGAPREALPTATRFDDVVDLLALAPLLTRRTAGLSGGEVQRIALGRALLAQPRLLLLDEPLSMLDPDRRDELLPYLQRVRDGSGLPMIYVSHVPAEVARIAQDVHRIDEA